jgi:hypothetical protein
VLKGTWEEFDMRDRFLRGLRKVGVSKEEIRELSPVTWVVF